MSRELEGTTALVTGAGQGIGQGIAFALAGAGAQVAVLGRTRSKLMDTVAEIHRRGGLAVPITCDVGDSDQIASAVGEAVAKLGSLRVLVNNAQEFNFGTINGIPVDLVEAGWRTGPMATLHFMREAHPHLAVDGGVVVNVSSSAAGAADLAGIGAYSAAKAAIESLSRAAAVEWAADGVRVNTIIPLARTPAVQASFDAHEGLEERLISGIPLGRLGDPETDIGEAVVYLCGRGARYVTGTTLSVDGGTTRMR